MLHRHVSTIRYSLSYLVGRFPKTLYIYIYIMGKLEKLIIQSAPHKPLSWFRFIDDVDMKWTESEENLNRFFDPSKNVHPTINSLMKHPEITSPFWMLTLPVKMVLCQLTYTTNRQIHISTCPHRVVIPKHCTTSIPYSQALRIKRIYSNEQTTKINGLVN